MLHLKVNTMKCKENAYKTKNNQKNCHTVGSMPALLHVLKNTVLCKRLDIKRFKGIGYKQATDAWEARLFQWMRTCIPFIPWKVNTFVDWLCPSCRLFSPVVPSPQLHSRLPEASVTSLLESPGWDLGICRLTGRLRLSWAARVSCTLCGWRQSS